ncbi:MAG: hypothetical protein SCK57_08865 [Bacillota bacterium]|nr:hypothetical protein [Bacillota bacterium]MDW7677757.1 hypothetical protein [Bacillota bacterium]
MDAIIILIVSALAGMAAFYISIVMGKGGVFGSAVVTLTAGVLFRYLEMEGLITITGLAVVATTASYAGMVAQKNVENLKEMAVVGLISGALYIAGGNVFVGVGGRLGTIAAIACFAWIGFKKITGKGFSSVKAHY